MPQLSAQLFICTSCTYKKDNGEMSSEEDAKKLRKDVKTKIAECFNREIVRVSACQCLGECENGIAAVLYPSGDWKLNLRPENQEELLKAIKDKVSKGNIRQD